MKRINKVDIVFSIIAVIGYIIVICIIWMKVFVK